MATANPLPQPTSTALSSDARPRRGGRPRRNGHLGRNHQNEASAENQAPRNVRGGAQAASGGSVALRPALLAPTSQHSSTEPSSAENSALEAHLHAQRGRGAMGRGRRGRGGGGETSGGWGERIEATGNTDGNHSRVTAPNHDSSHFNSHTSRFNSGRQFGGNLTIATTTDPAPYSTSILQGDAPVFRPGQPHISRPRNPRKSNANVKLENIQGKGPRLRRDSSLKSTAQDLGTRTHEDILNGIYECPICTNEVGRNSKVWSCKTCWTVFHLSCITKWSINEGSTLAQQRNTEGDLPPPRQWRCPGCNLPKDVLPSSYNCWCEKEVDPRPITGLPPHSCGQTCGKRRVLPKKCPHPCELLCHAGPCPPCTHLGPVQSCFCGKQSISRRCVDTNYDTGWSCGEICGDFMSCGEHTCQQPCHEGLCGACEVRIDCRCYCGKIERPTVCSERGEEKPSRRVRLDEDGSEVVEDWTGMFECESLCQRSFDCGEHTCTKRCHPQELESPHCPRSPDVVSQCPCGKTLLTDISAQTRKSCQDPIPNCEKSCLKTISCGHLCQQVCHSGVCLPCEMVVTIGCRCGRVQSPIICHQANKEPSQCTRTCKATLNCGRHECGQRCCSGERKATERQATKRKLRPLGASRIIDEGFESEHICTRVCGRPLKCGNHTCPELCHKGPCGSCREAIFDEISCHCGKTVLQPPLPCGTIPPSCRFDCERPKPCGHPRVPHNCHGDEDHCPKCPFLGEKPCMCGKKNLKNQPCWLADVRCGEVCGKKLKCGSHFCQKPCHRPGHCEDAGRPCQQPCGKAKKACGHPCEDLCHAPSSCREDKPCQNKMFVTCDCQHLKQEHKCNASKTSEGNSRKTLSCDDECARLARNRKLALALNIDPDAHKDDHIPYSNDTLNLFRESAKWSQTQEREFRVFAADEGEKRLRFKPMPPHQRAFIHYLAEDFGFDSESMDPEPHRHVAVFKTPRFVMAPMKTLAECLRIRSSAEATSITSSEVQKKTHSSNTAYNGFLLTHPRFGITIEEIRAEYSSNLDATKGLSFDVSFLPSEEIVIKARPATASTNISTTSIEEIVKALKTPLTATTSSKRLASSLQLCALDPSLNVVRRELDGTASNGGWSQVAAKAAAPRVAPRQTAVGEKSVYTVLGSKLKDAKKKREELQKAKEAVVEDWEEEVRKEEEIEQANG